MPDGTIPALPLINLLHNHNAIWINQDWLTTLGMELPTTAEELVEVLRAFRDRDPNGNGRADETPLAFLGMWDLQFLSHAFGFISNDYSLYLDEMKGWFDSNVSEEWMVLRQELMSLLQEEASLNEIVKMVGMDALSPQDRLKMEAARSIREDYLHQNSFDEIDTYTSMQKQFYMQKLVYLFYDESVKALGDGADINDIVAMKVREDIGRYKYTEETRIEERYKEVHDALIREISGLIGKEEN